MRLLLKRSRPSRLSPLNGQAGTTSSGGTYTPTAPGRYKVTVAYYEQGQVPYESEAEVVFLVSPSLNGGGTITSPPPSGSTPPGGSGSPGETPGGSTPSTPGSGPSSTTPVVKPPVVVGGHLKPPATGSGPAKLCLTSAEKAKTVLQGGNETWTLKVKNCGGSKATGVKVTDPLIPGISLTNLGHGKLVRGSIIFSAGTLNPGQTKTFTFVAHFASNAPVGKQTNRASAKGTNTSEVKSRIAVTVIALPQAPTVAPVTG